MGIPCLKTAVCFGLAVATRVSAWELPPPTGKYNVGATKHVIEFYNDDDPFAPGGIQTSFLATLYYPTLDCNTKPIPVLEPEVAEIYEKGWGFQPGDLASLTTTLKWNASTLPHHVAKGATLPTIIFGPAGGGPPSSCYTTLHTELASLGYTVAALDHFIEQPFLRYPNGTGVFGLDIHYNYTIAQIQALYAVRVRDTVFFVDQWPALVDSLHAPFDKTHLGAYGGSLGGAVSFGAAIDRPEILSALNMDGTNWGKPAANDSSADAAKPVMQFGSDGHFPSGDPTWGVFPDRQTGWWETAYVRNASHSDFLDATIWKRKNPTNRPFGAIDGDRMVDVLRTYVTAFFNYTLLGQEEPILEGNSTAWPDVYIFDGSEF